MAWRLKWWDENKEQEYALMQECVEIWTDDQGTVTLNSSPDGWIWATLEEGSGQGPTIRWHHPPDDVKLRGDNGDSKEPGGEQSEWSVQPGQSLWFGAQKTGIEIVAVLGFGEGRIKFIESSVAEYGVDDQVCRNLWKLHRQVALGAGWQQVLKGLGKAATERLGMSRVDGRAALIWEGDQEFYHQVIWDDDDSDREKTQWVGAARRRGVLASLLTRERELLDALQARGDVVLRTHTDESIDLLLPICGEEFLGAFYLAGIPGANFDESYLAELVDTFNPIGVALMRRYHGGKKVKGFEEENRYFRERERRHYLFKDLVCESAVMRQVYDELHDRVDQDSPILMTGEAGTGKELLARALHHLGDRHDGMLIRMGCASFPRELVDFELFGCVASELTGAVAARKGIFELAEGGTVFLDEVDRLSPMVQGKLVRVLKEKEVRRIGDAVGRPVDARFIASSHRDLDELCRCGQFRRDLFELLDSHRMAVPPLRKREADILPLARIFLKKFAERYDARCQAMDKELKSWLVSYPWPGNVRQLQTFIEAAVLMVRDQSIIERDALALETMDSEDAQQEAPKVN